ncbi:hypothetical protein BST61_g62 [Cercospora zeina]
MDRFHSSIQDSVSYMLFVAFSRQITDSVRFIDTGLPISAQIALCLAAAVASLDKCAFPLNFWTALSAQVRLDHIRNGEPRTQYKQRSKVISFSGCGLAVFAFFLPSSLISSKHSVLHSGRNTIRLIAAMEGHDPSKLNDYYNSGNEWWGSIDPTLMAAEQGFAAPTPQQAQPAAPTPNVIHNFREDIGWFVKADYTTLFSAIDANGFFFYYNPVPPPPSLSQQAYQSPITAGYNGGFVADYPGINTQQVLPEFEFYPEALNGPYVAQTPSGMPVPRRSTRADTHRRVTAKSRKRAQYHRRSIIQSCTCQEGHISRPPNAFIVFRAQDTYPDEIRAYMTREEKIHLSGRNRLPVDEVSRLWNVLPANLKTPYKRQAEIAKERHATKYPGYKYKPQAGLAREFGNENCTCGAYQVNMDARKQRGTGSQEAVSAPKKASRPRRKGKQAVVQDVSQTYTAPPGFAPMGISNAGMANPEMQFNPMMNPSNGRRQSAAGNVLQGPPSRRLTRGANPQVNYAEPQAYEEDENDALIRRLGADMWATELKGAAGTYSKYVSNDLPVSPRSHRLPPAQQHHPLPSATQY